MAVYILKRIIVSFLTLLLVAAIYLLLVIIFTALVNKLERRLKRNER